MNTNNNTEKIIVSMNELGRVTFSPDTTSGGGSPGSLIWISKREIELCKSKKTEKVDPSTQIKHIHVVFSEMFQIQRHTRSLWLKGAHAWTIVLKQSERERESQREIKIKRCRKESRGNKRELRKTHRVMEDNLSETIRETTSKGRLLVN